jgi:hypothetical protein
MILSRDVLNLLWPEGAAWTPATDDDYDKLLEGISENSEYVRLAMFALRYLRDPLNTTILSDLEKEFAVYPTPGATEEERRQRLANVMFGRSEQPTYELLQAKLRNAGFDVYVHANSPAVDPDLFLAQNFNMMCGELLPGGNDAQCGEPEAICAETGGELLVNGEIFLQFPNYTFLCGEADAQCGEPDGMAGQYDSIRLEEILYEVPAIAGYWPMIFFVGGPATRDPVTGALTEIEMVTIPIEREAEFKKLILRYKVMASWAALIAVFG